MGKTYEFTEFGIVDHATKQLVSRGSGGRLDDVTSDIQPEPARPVAAKAQAQPVRAQSTEPLRPRDVIRLAKARKREIDRDLKRLRSELTALEREKVQIDALVKAASRPLASVSPITHKRTG